MVVDIMQNKKESVLTNKKHIIALMAILSLLVTTAGYFYYKGEEKSIRQEKYDELKAITDLKQNQIELWIKQRNADVKVVAQSPFFIKGIEEWLQDTSNGELRQNIVELLQPVQEEQGYENIFLATLNGQLLVSAKSGLEEFDSLTKQKIIESSKKREISSPDIYWSQIENEAHYDIITPITDSGKETIAVLLFRTNLKSFLYPLIQTWPTPSKSAESVILRVEKDSVLFLNDLRFRKNAALKLKISLTQTEIPAVQAALGHTGIFEGIDYRGVEVLSDIRMIPTVNWIMISKVDRSEIYSGLYLSAAVISGFSVLLIIICGIGFAFIYKERQKNIFIELYDKEKELWRYQERFKITLDSLGEGVITADTTGKIQYLNKVAEELTGWNLREAKGRQLHDIYSVKNEDTGQRENNIVVKVLKQGIVKELANHTLLVSKSGKEIPVMDTGAPIFDNDGSIIGLVLTFQDETEKRRQNHLLEESERRFRSTLDNMLEGCQIIGFDWRYIYINNSAEKHNRRPKEELLHNKYMDMWPGVEQTNVFKKIKRCLEERVDHIMENEFAFPDGKKGWFELRIQTIPDGALIQSYDITDRKRAEEEYKKLSRAVIQSPISVVITDPNGDIEYVNPKFSEVTGYSMEEVIGHNPRFLKSGNHTQEFYKNIWDTILQGKEWKGEIQNKNKKGENYWDHVLISPMVNENGDITNFVEIKEDITERKKMLGDLLEAKEKAEEINKVKSHFFANMSHELRTPFVGIMGYAELLSDSLTDPNSVEMAAGILNSSKRMMETLTKILNLSKLEFDGIELVWQKIDITGVITTVHKQFAAAAEQKNLSFKTKINFESFFMETDKILLSEILNNLVSNAIIYTEKGGIEISAEKQIKNNKDMLILKVADSGIGIPKDKQEIIWEEFRQASEGFTRRFEGTGLGLSIAKKYTESLGGKIYLESEEGKGSIFILELPISDSNLLHKMIEKEEELHNRIDKEVRTPKNLSYKKILYVEDDKTAIDVIKRALSKNYEIEFAENAEIALSKVNENNYDAILMDINLGRGINGEELTQKIRKMPGYESLPIIAATAYASDNDKKEFLAEGMSHYIAKPFSIQELSTLMERVFKTE